jgi:hypothetical protein
MKPVPSWLCISWLSSIQVITAIAIFPLGFAVISWLAAESPKDNPSIPAHWRAGVPNHGGFYQWPFGTVSDGPIEFAVCLLVFIGSVLFLGISAFRAQRARRRDTEP